MTNCQIRTIPIRSMSRRMTSDQRHCCRVSHFLIHWTNCYCFHYRMAMNLNHSTTIPTHSMNSAFHCCSAEAANWTRKTNWAVLRSTNSMGRWMTHSMNRWMTHSMNRWTTHSMNRWTTNSTIRLKTSY